MPTAIFKRPVIVSMLTLLLVIGILVANYLHGQQLQGQEKGLFGDMFGAANALFSGLAFAGVMWAVFLQREELRVAKDEISKTKLILEEQQKQLALQNEATRIQMFESTYFRLLNLLTEVTNSVGVPNLSTPGTPLFGKNAMDEHLNGLRRLFDNTNQLLPDDARATTAINNFFVGRSSKLDHYFRTLQSILSFIGKSEQVDARFYASILHAQLSAAEIALLFHFGVSNSADQEFVSLIETHGILDGLQNSDILDPSLKAKYDRSAYVLH